ncbi:MAG: DUF1841 family protein [Burkholderiaceae bacterium]
MFDPSQHDVRRFFCGSWRKHLERQVMTEMEMLAAHWIEQHPEYHDDFADEERALSADYSVENGQTNPFLHLSMHISIAEQVSINQPPGITSAMAKLAAKLDSEHHAAHELMECLGQVVWESQRSGLPPDGEAYLSCILQRSS